MAYIIAHGTVNGYQKIQTTLSDNRELQILTDIRTEFDNTSSMLTKSEGYLLQMSPSGVWVSIVKTLMDGERSGGGAGFFAFSAFVPKEQMIAGQQLKNILDKLMQHYLSLCPNFMTRNINIDWSFVTNASAELNALCQPRRKAINTYYVHAEQFACVPITTNEELVQYLDKPFQPEYGKYKAVFLGTHLQHPMRLTQQTCLNIDLENEEYDIIWNGNVNGWNNLPQKVRKKEIASGSYTFEKKYYDSLPVPYKSGVLDDVNTTLTLDVPNLQPQINQITLHYNHPEAIVMVQATSLSRTINDNNNILEFKGQEFADEIKVHLILKDGYRCDDFIVIPSECPNNIYYVGSIVKLKKITLNVLENSDNRTSNYKDNIRISKSGKSIPFEFNKANASLCLSISESDDFVKEYAVSLINGTYYSLSNLRELQSGFYTINIQRKQNSQIINTEPIPQERSIYLECDFIDQIQVYYDGLVCRISNNRIEIPYAGTRSKISVRLGRRELKIKKVGSDSIKIYSSLFSCLNGGNARLILIGVVAALMLLGVGLLTLQITKTIDIKKWFAKTEEQSNGGVGEQTPPANVDNISEDDRLYNELESILKIQRETWDYDAITSIVGEYGTTSVINSEHKAYKLYKELVWMQCRVRLDGYWLRDASNEKVAYNYYKKESNKGWIAGIQTYGINSDNRIYATRELLDLLKEIVNASDAKQKQFFENYVKTKEVEKKTFSEVKHLWDNFIPSPEQPPKNPKGGSKKTPPQSAQQTILNPE
jgi:hypothetical protein